MVKLKKYDGKRKLYGHKEGEQFNWIRSSGRN